MQPGMRTHFFLGADSRYGYRSLYNSVLSDEQRAIKHIIKGGYAFGKNVFLQRIAERLQSNGYDVECYRSSALPEYLDGLYIPEKKTVFLDGDMPHEISALYPGAVETYVDIGAMYDTNGLRTEKDAIIALTGDIEKARERMYRYMSAAGKIKDNIKTSVKTDLILETIGKRVKGLASREFKGGGTGTGAVSLRFMGTGDDCSYRMVETLCRRICTIDNDMGLSCEMLSGLRDFAVSERHDAVVCLDPFEPDNIEHLLLPGLSLAFVSQTSGCEFPGETYKHIRLDALPRETLSRHVRAGLKAEKKLLHELLFKCREERAEARRLYGKLDAIYTERLRLREVEEMAESYASALHAGVK